MGNGVIGWAGPDESGPARRTYRYKMRRKLGILAFMLLASSIAWLPLGGANALFSDTDTSEGNTIIAWVWEEADDLVVDTSGAKLSCPFGLTLYDITIENDPDNSPETSGEYDITIDKIRISWNPDGADIRVVNIWLEDWIEWYGEEPSGVTLDIEDCTLSPGEQRYISFTFDRDMHGKSFTITFIMSDGSRETVYVSP